MKKQPPLFERETARGARMKESFSDLRVHSQRLRANFETLAAIGAIPDGGVHRPALSDAHLEARRWFLERAQQMGLDARVDGAGNHSAVLHCGRAGGPTLLLGSHLDSVPYGGRFDGALGVLAALEVLQVVKEQGISLNTHLEAMDFTDEEGRFVGLLGSLALTGQLEPEHLQNPRGGRDRFQAALHHAGLRESSLFSAGRDPATLAGYLELHIEQGMRLMESGVQIGIVTSIVGIRSFRIRFIGRADHAGTRPMDRRLDAAQGASAFTLAARELVMKDFPGRVVNVGNMKFEPGAFNVVPQIVTVALEFRADDDDKLDEMEAALLKQASVEAQRFGLDLETERLDSTSPARMHERVQEAYANASKSLGLKYTFLPSGAGHDAQALARICPTGMIFVPSMGGFSHSSKEFTEWEDCANGTNVLLHAALLLAR
jgi:N-carbamoyl-L-amino-acid hydrolase